MKWYGGVIVNVANKGKKIKIEYDDGTSEVADFPDRDIIVDDVNNGCHGSGVLMVKKDSGGGVMKEVNRGDVFRPTPTPTTSSSFVGVKKMDGNEDKDQVEGGEKKKQ